MQVHLSICLSQCMLLVLLSITAIHCSIGAVVDLQLPVQSILITTEVVNSNPVHVEVYLIQHCDKVCQ